MTRLHQIGATANQLSIVNVSYILGYVDRGGWHRSGTFLVNVPPDSANLVKTSVMLKVHEWVVKLPFQEMCWSYSKQTANGTRNVAYYMTTGLGPVSATHKKKLLIKTCTKITLSFVHFQEAYYSGDSSFESSKSSSRFKCKVVGGKKRGPRPKKLTWEEKRQKRSEANNRERQRMGQLNSAFDSLRYLLPKHGNDRELSKFETIQVRTGQN